MRKKISILPNTVIENKILLLRGKKVMLDKDLADLYQVPTKIFNQAIKRNLNRFPNDFMFRLNRKEFNFLRSHFVTSKNGETRGGRQYLPLVFTEQGVAMLSGILNSPRAVQVNIQIMRTFIKLREIITTHKDLRHKIEDMERKYDQRFSTVFKAIRQLLENDEAIHKRLTYEEVKEKNRKWGFVPNSEK